MCSWPADYTLKPHYSLNLWQDQRHIRNIELYERSWEERPDDVTNALSKLKHVISLRISPDTLVGLKNVNKIMRNIPILSLHIDLRSLQGQDKTDAKRVPGILFSHALMASSKLNPNTHWKLQLSYLVLWNVDFADCEHLWMRFIDSTLLRVLELSHCHDVHKFLAAPAPHSDSLQSLTINHVSTTQASGSAMCSALETYLQTMCWSITKLVLRISGLPRLPTWACFVTHGPAVETLLLDISGTANINGIATTITYSTKALVDIFRLLPNLRQLGFIKPFSMDWRQIFKYTNPVTLYLLGTNDNSSEMDVSLHTLKNLYRPVAQPIFEQVRSGFDQNKQKNGLPLRLRVIALGRHGLGSSWDCKDILYYVKGEEVYLRTRRTAMVPVELRDLTKNKEEVDILIGEPIAFGLAGRL